MHSRRAFIAAAGALLAAQPVGSVFARKSDTGAIDGIWEGPWYRGMSSGKARFEIRDGAGTMELTNAETFGDGPHPLQKTVFDGKTFSFEAPGGGGPMRARLELNARGDQMKGMGKHEGFGVRFELARTHR